MALDQQTIQGLNQYAGNEAVQVGGNIPLVPTVSENALNKLLEVTDNYAKEKRAEKDEWEKSVAERIATISKTDGVLSKDIAEISKDKKELINYIRENSYLLAPSNQVKQPEKYAELEGKVQDYLSKVEKSKADNVIWKEYQKVSAKPEYANPVMKKRADNFTNKPIMEREAFTLSATPKPLKESDLESIFASIGTATPVSNVFGADNSLVSVQNEYAIDRNVFVKKAKSLYPEQAQFFKEYYEETIPEEEKTMLAEKGIANADDYADFQLGNLVPESGVVRGAAKTMPNPAYTWQQKKEMQQVAEAGKDKRAQWTNATRVDIAEKNNAYKYWKDENGRGDTKYPALASVITQVNQLETKGNPSLFKGYTEIGANEVPANIISAVYPGGQGNYKGAFGTLFRSEKNGVTTYTLGVEKWYEKTKGQPDYTKPDNMNIHNRVPDEYASRIEPSTDANDTYTEAQLLEKASSLNDASRKEYNEAISKNPDLFSFYGAGGQQTQSNQAASPQVGKLKGINEMFWNPMGRKYDQGSMAQGTEKGHDNHIHFGFEAPDVAVAVIKKAQELGLSVRENPYVEKVDPVHTKGSFHYSNFAEKYNGRTLGKGLDVSGDKTKMRQLFEWAETTYGGGVPSSTPAKSKSTATKSTGKKKGNAKDYGLN